MTLKRTVREAVVAPIMKTPKIAVARVGMVATMMRIRSYMETLPTAKARGLRSCIVGRAAFTRSMYDIFIGTQWKTT